MQLIHPVVEMAVPWVRGGRREGVRERIYKGENAGHYPCVLMSLWIDALLHLVFWRSLSYRACSSIVIPLLMQPVLLHGSCYHCLGSSETKLRQNGAGMWLSMGCPRSVSEHQYGSTLLCLPCSFLLVLPCRQRRMAQVLGSQPPTWQTLMEFLAPGFDLVHAWLLRVFGE